MIAAILLAAGSARRFGGPQKLLALVPFRDAHAPLVRAAAAPLADPAIGELIVVLGPEPERVREAMADVPARFVRNEHHALGMASSIHAGVRAAARDGAWTHLDGLLVALGDQPLGGAVVRALVDRFRALPPAAMPGSVVVPRYDGTAGHPVLFGRDVIPELLSVAGDRGGRAVVERDPGRVHHVELAYAAMPDVDTPEDLRRLITLTSRAGAGG